MASPPSSVAVALGVLVLLSGCFGLLGGSSPPGSLEEDWLSDTERDIEGNHHAVAAARIDGQPMVFVPLSGHAPSGETAADGHQHSHAQSCALVGIDGTTGGQQWTNPTTEKACTIHAIADPTVADVDGDGDQEVVAATTEERLTVSDPVTGFIQATYRLSDYGFTRPLVGDFLTGDEGEGPDVVVVDVNGTVLALSGDTPRWNHELGADVQAQPRAADVDDDPQRELVVGTTGGSVVALDVGEGERWNRTLADAAVTWLTAGQADDDPRTEVAAATYQGEVVLLDDDGSPIWRRDLGRLAAVEAFADGDGDGEAEVYATNKTGTVTALAANGSVEWRRDVVEADDGDDGGDVQMTPPPVLGDVSGDGSPELVVADNAGGVTVLDPADGTVLAKYDRDVPVWVHPTLADLDGDGSAEILVMYGDGRVARLSYVPPE